MNRARRRFELPLVRPLRTADGGTLRSRSGVLLSEEGGGITGWAELTPHPDVSHIDAEQAYQALTLWGQGSEAPDAPRDVRAAIESVRLDRHARGAGVPVASLLAPDPLDAVPVNGFLSREEGPAEAAVLAAGGFGTLKVKVGGRAVEDDASRIGEIRAAVGDAVRLRLDASGSWAAEEAVEILRTVARYGIEYVEDPVPVGVELAAAPVEIALDAVDPTDRDLDRIDVLVIKPALIGPIAAMKLAGRARGHGCDVVITSVIDGAVGVAAAAHVAAALRVTRACGLATSTLLARDIADPPPIRDGSMALTGPGLGVVLSADVAAQAEVAAFSHLSKG